MGSPSTAYCKHLSPNAARAALGLDAWVRSAARGEVRAGPHTAISVSMATGVSVQGCARAGWTAMRCRRPGRHADLAGDSGAGHDGLALPSFSMVASGRRSKSRSRSAHSIIRWWRNHQNRLKIYRKISVRLSRRRPRLVEAKINPDCHVSSIGSAFRGIGRSPIWTALVIASARVESVERFRARLPSGGVLVPPDGEARDYGRNPYVGYDSGDRPF